MVVDVVAILEHARLLHVVRRQLVVVRHLLLLQWLRAHGGLAVGQQAGSHLVQMRR